MILPSNPTFWQTFKSTPGAISTPEAIAIMTIAQLAPQGNYIEAGSHKGKSAMSAMVTLHSGRFYLIDPIFEDNELAKTVAQTLLPFANHLEIHLIADISTNELPKHDNYAYAFIDSDQHTYDLVSAEINIIKDKMVKGGIIAFHDWGNQFIAPRQVGYELVASGEFELVEIDWKKIFDYVRENNIEEGNNSWHEKGSNEFPCYVGAVRKK